MKINTISPNTYHLNQNRRINFTSNNQSEPQRPQRQSFFSRIRDFFFPSATFNQTPSQDVFIRQNEPKVIKVEVDGIEFEREESEMEKFFQDPDYDKKVSQATQGKYQKELNEMLLSDTIDQDLKHRLGVSGLTQEEFLSSLRKLSKSTFKVAMNKPNQYINYTQDSSYLIFGYESLDKGIRFNTPEDKDKAFMVRFFEENLSKMLKALRYIDTDTLNQMMDKRTTGFRNMLNSLNDLSPENGDLLKSLIDLVPEGNAKQKIKLCQLVTIFEANKFDMTALQDLVDKGELDTTEINKILKTALVQKAGVEEIDVSPDEVKFNEDYVHLLFSRFPMLNNGNPHYDPRDLSALLKAAVQGNFDSFILDETNPYGQVNKNTRLQFEELGLDYDQWLKPDMEPLEFDLNGKK